MPERKRFGDRPPAASALIAMITLASLVVVFLAERDLKDRPAGRVRGSKLLWRLASLNALGALAYLGYGRR